MMNRAKAAACTAAVLAFGLFGGTQRAQAGPGTLTLTGTLTGQVGITDFSDAAFTAVTTFPWPLGTYAANATDYPSSLTFTIGSNTYTSVAADGIDTVIWQPGNAPDGIYGVEVDATNLTYASGNFIESFDTETYEPATQTELLSDVGLAAGSPFSMLLTDGETLDVTAFNSFGPTASIYVPEPAGVGLLLLGVAATLGVRRRRRA